MNGLGPSQGRSGFGTNVEWVRTIGTGPLLGGKRKLATVLASVVFRLSLTPLLSSFLLLLPSSIFMVALFAIEVVGVDYCARRWPADGPPHLVSGTSYLGRGRDAKQAQRGGGRSVGQQTCCPQQRGPSGWARLSAGRRLVYGRWWAAVADNRSQARSGGGASKEGIAVSGS